MINTIAFYITAGILFNLFIDFLVWIFFKYDVLPIEDTEHIPWDTRTKVLVTFTWPAVLLFLLWSIFINPREKNNDE